MNYYTYINSVAWRDRRRRHLQQEANHVCWNCGEADGRKEVHHVTYERLGCEADADLITLCEPCHEIVHTLKKSGTPLARCHLLLKQYNVSASTPETQTVTVGLAAKIGAWQTELVEMSKTLNGGSKSAARECWKALAKLKAMC